jgi:hypothetical protein
MMSHRGFLASFLARQPNRFVWWHCPLCPFRMQDDGTLESAKRMGEHVAVHEREEQKKNQRLPERVSRQ